MGLLGWNTPARSGHQKRERIGSTLQKDACRTQQRSQKGLGADTGRLMGMLAQESRSDAKGPGLWQDRALQFTRHIYGHYLI